MAANDPRPAVDKAPDAPPTGVAAPPAGSKKPSLSIEDAELFASRIRPSWELVDDSLRGDLAADFDVAPNGVRSGGKGSDTIIEGVPTLSIGSGPMATPPEAPLAERIQADGAAPRPAAAAAVVPRPVVEEAAAKPASKTLGEAGGAPKPVAKTVGDAAKPAEAKPSSEPKKTPTPAPVNNKAGKTRTGVGDGPKPVSKTLPDAAPASKPAPSAKPAVPSGKPAVPAAKPAGASKPGKSASGVGGGAAVAASVSRSGEDDIEIPVTGASGGMIKVGLGVAVVLALGAIGYGLFGGSSGDKKTADTTPTATARATATAVPLPATVPAPPPLQPEPTAKAVATATVATATTAAAAPPPSTAAAAPASPATAAPVKATAEPKKAAPPADHPVAPKPSTPPPATPKKPGGGIIRDSPF
jgi:hypothetical protein